MLTFTLLPPLTREAKQLNRTLNSFALATILGCTLPGAYAATEKEATAASRRGDFAAAADIYKQLVAANPSSVSLRIEYADALVKDRQWEAAVSEYEAVLKLQPKNIEATLGIATARRRQGNITEAKRYSEQAHVLAPQNADAHLGLASTYALDHDFERAGTHYADIAKKFPKDAGAQQSVYNFQRQRNPRLYAFLESDLSFETKQLGVSVPFLAREEIGAEVQEETSFVPSLGNLKIFSRNDKKIFYTHHFGLNHMFDVSARTSEYQYNVVVNDYASIDTYREFRFRYTMPLTNEHTLAVRYTPRPTTLKVSQETFTAHKIEAEVNSRLTPRLTTLIGTGWLRELDSNATNVGQLTDRSLVRLGFQFDATNRLSVGARFITNPDLDNTVNSTLFAEGSYTLNSTWSVLGRLREDDYKTNFDQTSYYAAARFVPDSHWWSEFGLKYVTRGLNSGVFGLASITYRF
jgi:tetratricopeptide (TPR) repeat protein